MHAYPCVCRFAAAWGFHCGAHCDFTSMVDSQLVCLDSSLFHILPYLFSPHDMFKARMHFLSRSYVTQSKQIILSFLCIFFVTENISCVKILILKNDNHSCRRFLSIWIIFIFAVLYWTAHLEQRDVIDHKVSKIRKCGQNRVHMMPQMKKKKSLRNISLRVYVVIEAVPYTCNACNQQGDEYRCSTMWTFYNHILLLLVLTIQ